MNERSALHREVANLRVRVDVLEEEVRQLRDAFEPSVAMPEVWKLTKSEARLLHVLPRTHGNYLTKERILTALYGLEPDVDIKIVDVFVCKAPAEARRGRQRDPDPDVLRRRLRTHRRGPCCFPGGDHAGCCCPSRSGPRSRGVAPRAARRARG